MFHVDLFGFAINGSFLRGLKHAEAVRRSSVCFDLVWLFYISCSDIRHSAKVANLQKFLLLQRLLMAFHLLWHNFIKKKSKLITLNLMWKYLPVSETDYNVHVGRQCMNTWRSMFKLRSAYSCRFLSFMCRIH